MEQPMVVDAVDGHRRRAEVSAQLQILFSELSGMPPDELPATVGFLELGLDSLFLTQASTAIHKTFGVRVPFRDLLGDASTLEAVAARIDSELPPDPLPAQSAPARAGAPAAGAAAAGAPVAPVPAPAPIVASTSTPATNGNLLERLVAQQLELMSRQLELFRDGGSPVAPTPVPAPVVGIPAPRPVPVPARSARPEQSADRGTIAFGPYRPPAKGPTGGLTPTQQQALTSFVESYVKRTQKSKQFTAENRGQLADPRSVAGFRLYWKEMVYPIVTTRSAGSRLWDLDGNEYIDLTNGFGMILFGHNPPFIREAIEVQLRQGYRDRSPDDPRRRRVAHGLRT